MKSGTRTILSLQTPEKDNRSIKTRRRTEDEVPAHVKRRAEKLISERTKQETLAD